MQCWHWERNSESDPRAQVWNTRRWRCCRVGVGGWDMGEPETMRLASGHAHDGCQRTQQYVVLSKKRLFFYRAKFSPPHKTQTPPGNLKEPSVCCLPPALFT